MTETGARSAWCARHSDFVHGAFFFLFFVVASLAGTHDMPLLSDNQHYFFIAERAASGIPPHISQFDPKNALGMLIPAAAIRAGREFGIDDLLMSRVASIAAGALAVALMWPLTRRLTGSRTAAWLASAAMLTLNRFLLLSAMGSQPKVFLVLFVVASVLFLSMRRWAFGGLMAGAAFLCWQPAAALIVAGIVALLLGRAGGRAALMFLGAAVAALVGYEAYFVHHGVLSEQLTQAYWFPFQYMERPPAGLRPVLRRAGWVLGASQGVTFWSAVPLLFLAWLVRLWSGWWRRSSLVAQEMANRPDRIYLALGAHAAFANCLLSFQGFPDRFFLDPYMSITAAWLVVHVLDRARSVPIAAKVRRAVPAFTVLSLLVLAVSGHWDFRQIHGLSEQRKFANSVRNLLDAGFSVYAVGCTHLLAYNHADNFTPYGFFFRGVAESLQVSTGGRGYRPLRNGKLPDVILVSRGTYIEEQPWFTAQYAPAKRGDYGNQPVRVWMRVRRSRDVSPDTPATSGDSP